MDEADEYCKSGAIDERVKVWRMVCEGVAVAKIVQATGLSELKVLKLKREMPNWWGDERS